MEPEDVRLFRDSIWDDNVYIWIGFVCDGDNRLEGFRVRMSMMGDGLVWDKLDDEMSVVLFLVRRRGRKFLDVIRVKIMLDKLG